jgi:proline iminopeptidase
MPTTSVRGLAAGTALLATMLIAASAPAAELPAPVEGNLPIPGGNLHYVLRGQGEPMLVLSGGPGFSGDYMTPVASELADHWRTVLLDQRGTGTSRLDKLDSTTINQSVMVEDLERLRSHLGLKRWIVLGHSWGGMLAMSYAVAHPESVQALVLADSGGASTEFFEVFGANIDSRLLPEDRDAIAFWRDPAQRRADPRRATMEGLRALAPAYFFERKKALPFISLMRPEGYTSEVNRLMFDDFKRAGYDLRPRLRQLQVPTLVVHAWQDPIPETFALEIHQLIAGSQLHLIQRSGHFPWLEQPQDFYGAVRAFLGSLARP